MAPKYTLNYLPISGKAETIRLMFKYAGVEFTDNHYAGDEWQKHKTDAKRFPLSQMPTLEVDDRIICQSGAIYRFVANELGQYGSNNFEKADIDQIFLTVQEQLTDLKKIWVAKEITEEDRKKRFADLFALESTKKRFKFIVSFLENNSNGFFVGNKISFVDFYFYTIDVYFLLVAPSYRDNYPCLQALIERMNNMEAIKKHNAERKYSN